MKKVVFLMLCVLGVHSAFSQANKALALIDGMQKNTKVWVPSRLIFRTKRMVEALCRAPLRCVVPSFA